MSTSLICIVYSHNTRLRSETSFSPSPFSDAAIRAALQCTRAYFTTCAASSPEFSPNLTVLRADPLGGCQCVYQHFLPRTSHPVPQRFSSLHYYPSLEESRIHGRNPATEHQAHAGAELVATERLSTWKGRSMSWVEACVSRGLRAAVSSSSADQARAEVSADSPLREADRWGCLAGGLLMTCAMLQRHRTAHAQAHMLQQSAATAPQSGGDPHLKDMDEDEEEDGHSSSLPHQAWIVVLCDPEDHHHETTRAEDGGVEEVSFATECAFAVAATQLAKNSHVVLSCFGPGFEETIGEAAASASAPPQLSGGVAHLVALSNSLGGVCAPELTPRHLSRLFSVHPGAPRHRLPLYAVSPHSTSLESAHAVDSLAPFTSSAVSEPVKQEERTRNIGATRKRARETDKENDDGSAGELLEEAQGRSKRAAAQRNPSSSLLPSAGAASSDVPIEWGCGAERLTAMYAIAPTALLQPSSTSRSTSLPRDRVETGIPCRATHLVWLCPRCMCTVSREEEMEVEAPGDSAGLSVTDGRTSHESLPEQERGVVKWSLTRARAMARRRRMAAEEAGETVGMLCPDCHPVQSS